MRQTRADRDGVLPVLLLHGWTWSLDVNFFGLLPPLSQRHPIVGLDQRGHGRGLPIAGEFSIADCAEDVIAVLDVLNIDRVIVCGFSLGGLVGTHMALAHPQRVAGLVLTACALNYRQNRRDRLLWTTLATAAPLALLKRHTVPPRLATATGRPARGTCHPGSSRS
ncbi:alpha/beta fold hydrolase [Frankia sp. CiP1_Cm_nod1]|uniref:alpha/beta fold hydrolase n=1 Tax=Frankia sp. CiP1_Cm_nod1 TaxID=2897160 RepID=UPI0020242F33